MNAHEKDNGSYQKFLSTKSQIYQNVSRLHQQLAQTSNNQADGVALEVSKSFDFSRHLTRSQIQRLLEARAYLDNALLELWKVGIAFQECDIPAGQFFTGLNLAYGYVSSVDCLLSNGYNARLAEFNEQRKKAVNHG